MGVTPVAVSNHDPGAIGEAHTKCILSCNLREFCVSQKRVISRRKAQ